MTDRNDSLVADYLARVAQATAGLPSDRRNELMNDLREHIATGRAELESETEEQVREILERLGDPWLIAKAAAEDIPPVIPPSPGVKPAPAPRRPLWIIAGIGLFLALFLLCGGAFFFLRNDGGPATPPLPTTTAPAVSRSGGAS